MKKIVLFSFWALIFLFMADGFSEPAEQIIDRIVAVVGDEVILLSPLSSIITMKCNY